MKRLILQIIVLFLTVFNTFATHQRAGEITYKWISGFTYEVTLITYTYTPSPADRPELEVLWGDGSSSILPRTQKIDMPNDIRKNTYVGTHSYAAAGSYIVSMEDPNRNYGILNIPNSVNIPFYLETTLIINPFIGANNSPVLFNPPIDNGCVNQLYIHNPGAYDPDGDSLSYQLGVCKGAGGLDIPGYTLPSASNSISIDPLTGDLVWNTPVLQGEYNIAILIKEWRYGVLIGTVLRDMQIQIVSCDNSPPEIQALKDTCVEAGSTLSFTVTATDPDNDVVTLTAIGGPLVQTISPAQFQQPVSGTGIVSSLFEWQTTCDHVRKQPWQMYFKATDDGEPVNLVDLEVVNITVVAPAPQNLTAQPSGNAIILSWSPGLCTNAIGYKIYRRNGYYGFFPDYCETGVPSYTGYVQIADINDINVNTYLDNNNGQGLLQGTDYCYMLISYFADGAESYASLEACTALLRDSPVITNVSIRNTDQVNGSVYVAWSKPTELDTLQVPGPYKYKIFRSEGYYGSSLALLDSLTGLNDTVWIDTLLNTKNKAYSYRIDLFNDEPGNIFWAGSSQVASSVFLSITSFDNKLHLSWAVNAPWTNSEFVVYRFNDLTSQFDSIGYSLTSDYYDKGLVNGKTYCYKIKTIGDYTAPGFVSPIVNWSQIECGSPVDLEPPCAPLLEVFQDCDMARNTLHWQLPYDSCIIDVTKYEIFYSPLESGDLSLIQTISDISVNTFVHSDLNSIAGCYAVVAVDSFGNRSPIGSPICVDIDSCSLYTLPNIFTPDGDGINDYFSPFKYDFVDKIHFVVFDRWGLIVFETDNPEILWDGKNKDTGLPCSDGVYYYVCDVYEIRLAGEVKRIITGFMHLIRK